MKSSSILFLLLAAGLPAAAAHAQAYPTRPVRMIVAFPPGGPTDLVARLVAQHLTEALGYQVVTDNRPGAGGSVAGALMAKAQPDGHTLFLASNGDVSISPHLYRKMAYDPMHDLAPVTRVGIGQLVLMANPSLPVHTVKELIALARAKPGTVTYASAGVGSTSHLTMELLNSLAGTQMLHVPYKGAGPAMSDVMGGQVQLISTGYSSALPHIKSGRLRALGLTGPKRIPSNPDLPTIGETLPGYEATSWYGLFVTAGTPNALVQRLYGEVAAILKRPDVVERLAVLGIEPEGTAPAVFAKQMVEENVRWGDVIKRAKVPPQ